jgi:hypothetical protein
MSKSRRMRLQLVTSVPKAEEEAFGRAGKVTHDARGNAVWDWDIETGVLARKSVSELLSTFDTSQALSLDSDQDTSRDWAGDPYNRSVR